MWSPVLVGLATVGAGAPPIGVALPERFGSTVAVPVYAAGVVLPRGAPRCGRDARARRGGETRGADLAGVG